MEFELGILFLVIIVLMVFSMGVFLVTMAIRQREEDDAAPLIVIKATFIEKRKVRRPASKISSSSRIRFYATFEFEDGVRQEFAHVAWDDYYAYVKGDVGQLTLKGTRYIKFESEIMTKAVNKKGLEAVKYYISNIIDANYL